MAKGITEIIKDFKILHPKTYEKIYEKGKADAIDEILKIINKEITSLEERLSIETYKGRWVDEEKCLFAIKRLEHLSEQIEGDAE